MKTSRKHCVSHSDVPLAIFPLMMGGTAVVTCSGDRYFCSLSKGKLTRKTDRTVRLTTTQGYWWKICWGKLSIQRIFKTHHWTRVPWTLTAHLRKKLNKGFPKIYNCESNTFPKYNFLRMIGHFTLEKRLSYLSILPIGNDITKPLSCEETTKKNVENSVTEASPTIN